MIDFLSMEVKFFPRDVVFGTADKKGDKFMAFFIAGLCEFEVVSHHGTFFMAKLTEEAE